MALFRRLSQKQRGFTLIEVIVVAVIIAVLSAVAIPLYNGYIRDSRRRTAENVAGSAASFVGTYYAMANTEDGIKVKEGASGPLSDINTGTWYYSDKSLKTSLISLSDADTNRFLIPTNIAIQIDKGNKTVKGAHVAAFPDSVSTGTPPDGKDITDPYYYH